VALRWEHIKDHVLSMKQAKTEQRVEVQLNVTAVKLLGERGKPNEAIFKLPSHNATIKNLSYWAERAGVEKHITFHCARHTFGTLLAFYGNNNIKTISELLGHTSLSHTHKYVRIAEELRQRAVNDLPELNL
jgi:integrase/recombinase XerD